EQKERGPLARPPGSGYQRWIGRGASSSAVTGRRPAALAANPPRWLGGSRQVPGTRPYPLVPPLPEQSSLKSDHLLSAVVQLYGLGQDDGELEAVVERDRHALKRRILLPRPRVRAQRVRMREHVVGEEDRARLDLLACQLEQALVVVLLGVDED